VVVIALIEPNRVVALHAIGIEASEDKTKAREITTFLFIFLLSSQSNLQRGIWVAIYL
jgi:hypothetical protein